MTDVNDPKVIEGEVAIITEEDVNLEDFWSQQYEEATAGGSQNFLFPKEETTRVRLIGIGTNPHDWYRKVENEYQGKITPKFLVKGFRVLRKGEKGDTLLQAIVFTKGAWGNISNMAREGYDFMSSSGVGLIVNRLNNGGRISYTVMPAPVSVTIPEEILQAAHETPWDFYLEEYQKMQDGRDNSQTGAGNAASSVADQIVNAPKSPAEW